MYKTRYKARTHRGTALRRMTPHQVSGRHGHDFFTLGNVWQVCRRALLAGLHALEAEWRVLLGLVFQVAHLALKDGALFLLL
jgi:hypothetical protein